MVKRHPTVVYDLNGTLAPAIGEQALASYGRRMTDALEPLLAVSDEEIQKNLRKKDIVIEGKNISKKLARVVLKAISKPKRGTKAREVYYDLLETAIERGEVNVKALPDALAKSNTIEQEKKEGYRIVALSRGTDSLLRKVLVLSGLEGRMERIFSTIEFGGEKKAEAYAGVYRRLLREGYLPVRFYEDEFENIWQLFEFGLSVAGERYSFEIVWVDRKNESKNRKDEIGRMRKEYEQYRRKNWKSFDNVFRIRKNLLLKKA